MTEVFATLVSNDGALGSVEQNSPRGSSRCSDRSVDGRVNDEGVRWEVVDGSVRWYGCIVYEWGGRKREIPLPMSCRQKEQATW